MLIPLLRLWSVVDFTPIRSAKPFLEQRDFNPRRVLHQQNVHELILTFLLFSTYPRFSTFVLTFFVTGKATLFF